MDVKLLFLATLTGIIASTFKNIPKGLLDLFTYLFSYKVSTTSENSNSYSRLNDWLFDNCNAEILDKKSQCTRFRDDKDSIIYKKSLGLGKIWFFHKGNLFIINHERNLTQFADVYTLDVDIIGRGSRQLHDDILSHSLLMKDLKTIDVRLGYNVVNVAQRSMDTIYCNKIVKKNLLDTLDYFKNNKNVYQELQVPHRLGILMYGKAGTGKTSMAKAIASYTNKDVMLIKTKDLDNLEDTLRFLHKGMILLIEEIDTFVKKRSETSELSTEDATRLGNLLNLIDGISTPEDLIVIATTNYIDKLDDALIREGRFDLKFEMKYLEKSEVQEIIKEKGLNFNSFDKLEYPIAPCKLQLEIMKKLRED